MPEHPHFDASWCATDLGVYRPCHATYERYPLDSLPPLDAARFTGTFSWLGQGRAVRTGHDPAGSRDPEWRALTGRLSRHGLALPADFAAYHTSPLLQGSIDRVSVTGCWTDLSDPFPSPVEPGAHLVRFFRDQQDCVLWYLYLRPGAEPFVVHAETDLAEDEDEAEEHDDGPVALHYCAPTFEQWAYRFWIENRIWRTLHYDGEDALDPGQQDYLRHYGFTPPAPGPQQPHRPHG